MSLLRTRSFFLGTIITSVAWIVILYLYANISKTPSTQVPIRHKLVSRYGSDKMQPNFMDSFMAKSLQRLNRQENLINSNEDLDEKQFRENQRLLRNFENELNQQDDVMKLGMIHNPDDQRIRDEGYKRHAFNVLISNRLGYQRAIPDTRHPLCKKQTYAPELPSASIIICFYNEDPTTLLRTVYSIVDRTPSNLIHEVILVDDFTDDKDLKDKFTEHLKNFLRTIKVSLIRTPERAGLIRARMFGAHHATGEVLVFLDSHCEVNRGWLEPLLDRIRVNRTNVVCPIIDIINADTFEYSSSPIVRGGFNWGLHFKWDSVPHSLLLTKEDFIKPIRSPTMAGGLFAIDRSYFHEMGEYDAGMDIWGGENLEISFRIWMCGGTLEIIPCSRIGHVFRRRRPYGSPTGEDTLTRNSLRVAHVWMDDYKKYYFEIRPDAKSKAFGDVADRVELRKKLQCKSFDWYMKNVYPDLKLPTPKDSKDKKSKGSELHKLINKQKMEWKRMPPAVIGRYQLQLSGTNLCVESEDEVTAKGSTLILQRCSLVKRQIWSETEKHDFRLADLLCLDARSHFPCISKCHEMGGTQEWKHPEMRNTAFFNLAAGLCLGTKKPTAGEHVTMEMCSSPEARKWTLVPRR